jgi:hypothetical protein
MVYEDFDIDDLIKGNKVVNELVKVLKDVDIINDKVFNVMVTTKLPNVYMYKAVTKDLLVKQDDSLLREYVTLDYFKDIRLIDFMKDYNKDLSIKYDNYFKEFINEFLCLYNAYNNTMSYENLGYDMFKSKIFKQYIINIAYMCIDIYSRVKTNPRR